MTETGSSAVCRIYNVASAGCADLQPLTLFLRDGNGNLSGVARLDRMVVAAHR